MPNTVTPTIELLYRPVEDPLFNTDGNIPGASHAFMVYTDENGEQFIFSAFPESHDETVTTPVDGNGRLRTYG